MVDNRLGINICDTIFPVVFVIECNCVRVNHADAPQPCLRGEVSAWSLFPLRALEGRANMRAGKMDKVQI